MPWSCCGCSGVDLLRCRLGKAEFTESLSFQCPLLLMTSGQNSGLKMTRIFGFYPPKTVNTRHEFSNRSTMADLVDSETSFRQDTRPDKTIPAPTT
ncbi:hypothetical protein CEXT_23891 [Caerostris extrusa]|uniref:Uncharacterized protein n=1 Tax=Caerostris extrusa TaxID=172846 RepID=A0AAV4NV05_CAEEX|nr:hypothetical protein CEXT_23891 [Caerostris extrusa]